MSKPVSHSSWRRWPKTTGLRPSGSLARVISREGLRRPADYRDVFTVLRESGVIGTELGPRLESMAGFRNRLVHGYIDVEPGRVHDIATKDLADVETFGASVVTRFVSDLEGRVPGR